MAFYSFGRVKIVSRSGTRSAVATAAYHAGAKITNEYDGNTHDYSRKKNVGETYIRMPESAPAAWRDESIPAKERLAMIWNHVEMMHPAQDAQLARANYLALPHEFTDEECNRAVDAFIEKNCTSVGMGVTYSAHNKPGNRHVDLMYLMYEYGDDGKPIRRQKKEYLCRDKKGHEGYFDAEAFRTAPKGLGIEKVYKYRKDGEIRQWTPSEASEHEGWERVNKHPVSRTVKVGGWDDPKMVKKWRKSWAEILNEIYAERGQEDRVDHRSHKERGLSILPTRHVGWGPEREDHLEYNRQVTNFNQGLTELHRTAVDELNAIKVQVVALREDPQTEKSIERHEEEFATHAQTLTSITNSGLFSKETVERLRAKFEKMAEFFRRLIERWKERIAGHNQRKQDVLEAADRVDEATSDAQKAVETGIDDILERAYARSKEQGQGGSGERTKDDPELG